MAGFQKWRAIAIDVALSGSDLELSAIQLYGQAARIDGSATLSSSHASLSGALSNLADANSTTTCKFASKDVRSPGFWIQWEFATDVEVTGIALGSANSVFAFVSSLTLQYFDAGAWVSISQLGRFSWPGPLALGDVAWFDRSYDKVVLLLRGDGTAIADESPSPMEVSTFGAAAISSAQAKFGGKSITFGTSGSGNYLQLSAPSKLAFGSQDFTFETWCYYVAGIATSVQQVCYHNYLSAFAADSIYIGRHPSVGSRFSLWAYNISATSAVLVDPNLPPENAWVHYAVCRSGSQLLLLRDYQVVATSSFAGSLTSATVPYGFVSTGDGSMRGFLDDFRVTMGVCRYPTSGDAIMHACPPLAMAALPLHMRSGRPAVAASSFISNHSMRNSRAQLARDTEFGGAARFPFTVEGMPTSQKARVSLFRARDRLLAREAWSAEDGAGVFTGLDVNTKFIAIAQDPSGLMHPVGAAHYPILPESST